MNTIKYKAPQIQRKHPTKDQASNAIRNKKGKANNQSNKQTNELTNKQTKNIK